MTFYNVTLHRNPTVEELERYLERFELWLRIANVVTEDDAKVHLLLCIESDAYRILKPSCYPKKPLELSFCDIKAALRNRAIPMPPVAMSRTIFYGIKRFSNESVKDFVERLESQAAKCR